MGPRATNSSLDDTRVKVVMPTWEQNPHQLYIPEDQPLALAADRENKAQRSRPAVHCHTTWSEQFSVSLRGTEQAPEASPTWGCPDPSGTG